MPVIDGLALEGRLRRPSLRRGWRAAWMSAAVGVGVCPLVLPSYQEPATLAEAKAKDA